MVPKEASTVLIIDFLADLCPIEKPPEFKGTEIVFLDLPKVSGFMFVS
jgi:hypothetical protein